MNFKLGLGIVLSSLLTLVLMFFLYLMDYSGIPVITGLLALALSLRQKSKYKPYVFSVFVFTAVAVSLYYPHPFREIGSFKLDTLIIPILMLIMFGMGTKMSLKDFSGILRMPKGVLIGLICQFSVMPFIGFGIAMTFGFPPEIAAGIILVGSSPSGLASNVMSYISRANLALSLTLTIMATLLSPLLTPIFMQFLANRFVPIDFTGMMWSITKIVILPVIAGLEFNRYFHGKVPWLDRAMPLVSMIGIAVVITIITASGRDALLSIGPLLILAVLLHNSAGYVLGFSLSRLAGMDVQSARTIAFEVGMQNSGLASGIALEMGRVATMGLAPAVFGPLMNITGSSLAAFWRDRQPVKQEKKENDELVSIFLEPHQYTKKHQHSH